MQFAAKRKGLTLVIEELDEVIGAEDNRSDGEILGIIEAFLREEIPQNRTLFLRRYWRGDSIRDAADYAGLSVSAAKMRLSRMRTRLKDKLNQEGIEI